MESIKIEQLLDKYLNAETTIQEETFLSDYFTSGQEIPSHLEEYQALFGYFADNKSERFTKTIQLNTQRTNWKWLSVAASVALLISVYTGYHYNQKEKARIAFENTQMAFQLLSKNYNKGTAALTYLSEYQTTTNKIFKQPN